MSEWASEQTNKHSEARERSEQGGASKWVSSAEKANEWAVRANERAEERMAQYSTQRVDFIVILLIVHHF